MSSKKNNHGLHDDELRKCLASDFKNSYMVDAGAGTGKTTVLVSRIVGAIESGIPLSRIAAITFTEKAAGELAMRLREKIDEKSAAATNSETTKWKDARFDIENAYIGTIHSFCASLLRKRPIEAGVDPNFEVADTVASQTALDAAWKKWINRQLYDAPDLIKYIINYGIQTNDLREIAFGLIENRDLISEIPDASLAMPAPKIFAAHFEKLYKQAEALSAFCKKPDEDKLYIFFQTLEELLSGIKTSAQGNCLEFIEDFSVPKGNKSNWKPQETKDEFKSWLDKTEALAKEWNEEIGAVYANRIINLLSNFANEYEAVKHSAGILDFQDLLLKARNMLRGDDRKIARKYFQNIFDIVLVDEFQDTDPLQVEVAFLLSEKEPTASRWDEVTPADGKLFLVGDPKQSIYRFRRADIEMYRRIVKNIGNISHENLVQNFRSAPALVTWFNDFFDSLFNGAGNPLQACYENIFPPPDFPVPPSAATPGVWALPVPDIKFVKGESSTADKARESESKTIAQFLSEIKAVKWPVRDVESKQWRQIEWKDIAILFRNRTGLSHYSDALYERGIPYAAPGAGGLFGQSEIRALIACLIAIDKSENGVSLIGALRSQIFGFSDEEILRAKLAGIILDYSVPPPDCECAAAFKPAFELLDTLHRKRNDIRKSELVLELLEKTGTIPMYSLTCFDHAHLSNLFKVVAIAREFDAHRSGTFRRFVDYLLEYEKAGEIEQASEGESEDPSVKLMTVHGAKGLEFPLVIIANMVSKNDYGPGSVIADRDREDVSIKLGDFKSKGWDNAEKKEKEQAELEKDRLLYVACTRARDYLVLPIPEEGVPSGLTAKAVAYINEKGRESTNFYSASGVDSADAPKRRILLPELSPSSSVEPASEILRRFRESRRMIVEKLSRPDKYKKVTGVAKRHLDLMDEESAVPVDKRAAALGTFVHKLIELVDFKNPATLDSFIDAAVASSEIFDEDIIIGAAMARRALDTDIIKRAAKSQKIKKEFPVQNQNEKGEIISGVIDLIFEEDGQLVIVDYKTDNVADINSAMERMNTDHRNQGKLYAEFIEKIAEMKVKETVILFLRPETPIALSI